MNYQKAYDAAIEAGNTELAQSIVAAASEEDKFAALAKGLAVLSMMGAAVGEALLVKEAFKAIGRNPKLEETLFSKVILSVALVESTAIYAFVALFII